MLGGVYQDVIPEPPLNAQVLFPTTNSVPPLGETNIPSPPHPQTRLFVMRPMSGPASHMPRAAQPITVFPVTETGSPYPVIPLPHRSIRLSDTNPSTPKRKLIAEPGKSRTLQLWILKDLPISSPCR